MHTITIYYNNGDVITTEHSMGLTSLINAVQCLMQTHNIIGYIIH